jgi:hypothetical protein
MLTIEQTRYYFGACKPAVNLGFGLVVTSAVLRFLIFPLGGTF